MRKTKYLALLLVIALALGTFGIAMADSHDDPPPEEGYTHPVVELLAEYFGSVSEEDQEAAAEVLETEGGLTVVDVVDNEDGTYTVEYDDGTFEDIVDAELAAAYEEALATLLDAETGAGVDALYEEIEAYHQEDDWGLGVLAKLYAIAEGGDVTVEELMAEFESGGMGGIFENHGKPDIMGVGHVKQALGQAGPPEHSNAGGNGNGNGGEHGPPDHANNGGNGGGNGPPDHANNDKDKNGDE